MQNKYLLKANNINMKIKSKLVLNRFSLTLNCNNIIGIVGPEKSGKSSIIKIIGGVYPDYSGEILFNLESSRQNDRKAIGAIIEKPTFFENLTGYENILYFQMNVSSNEIDLLTFELCKMLDIFDYLDRKVKYYTPSMKKRLDIVQALIGQPTIILFDEPFKDLEGMYKAIVRDIMFKVSNMGAGIIITASDIKEIYDICDSIVILDNGNGFNVAGENKKSIKIDNKVFRMSQNDKRNLKDKFLSEIRQNI